jgi:hypothetical protein
MSTSVSGTDIGVATPATWSVDSSVSGTWDQAAWLNNDNNFNNALEVGFYSGFFPYDGTWTSGLQPYETQAQGANGVEYSGSYVPAATYIDENAKTSANSSVYQYGFVLNYAVGGPTDPRLSDSQGEVVGGTSSWMGNGSGYASIGWWQASGSSTWNAWGYHDDCSNAPYSVTHTSAQGWTAGGY